MEGSSETVSQPPGASVAAEVSRIVFLSYASPDAEIANTICQFLESHRVPLLDGATGREAGRSIRGCDRPGYQRGGQFGASTVCERDGVVACCPGS